MNVKDTLLLLSLNSEVYLLNLVEFSAWLFPNVLCNLWQVLIQVQFFILWIAPLPSAAKHFKNMMLPSPQLKIGFMFFGLQTFTLTSNVTIFIKIKEFNLSFIRSVEVPRKDGCCPSVHLQTTFSFFVAFVEVTFPLTSIQDSFPCE